jgi:hypothetical protein
MFIIFVLGCWLKPCAVDCLLWPRNFTFTLFEFQVNILSVFFTFGCCILLCIYPTGSLWCRRSQRSFNTSTPPFLFFLLTHYMFRPLRVILRWDIQLDVFKDYSYYNGSVVRTQLDVCLYWYFDPWSPIHVIKLSIKVVKTLIFTAKLVSYIKYRVITKEMTEIKHVLLSHGVT